MATHDEVDTTDIRERIDALDRDRATLEKRLQAPRGLMWAAGAAVAWFVADAATSNPGVSYRPNGGYLLSIAALLVISHLVQKEVGVRFRQIEVSGWLMIGATVVSALVLFSVGLMLVSTGHRWLTVVPILLAWAVGAWGATSVFRACARAAGRG
jgi:hypothetical protein